MVFHSQLPPWSKGLTARSPVSRWQESPILDSHDPTDIHCSEWYILNYFDISISIHIHSYPFVSHIPYSISISIHPWYLMPSLAGFQCHLWPCISHIPYPIVYSLHPWYLMPAFLFPAGFHAAMFFAGHPHCQIKAIQHHRCHERCRRAQEVASPRKGGDRGAMGCLFWRWF